LSAKFSAIFTIEKHSDNLSSFLLQRIVRSTDRRLIAKNE
jgi:hypothetical protein